MSNALTSDQEPGSLTPAQVVTTAKQLTDLPNPTAFIDKSGDIGVWLADKVHYPESRPLDAAYAVKHYGPLVLLTVAPAGSAPVLHTEPSAEDWDKTCESYRDAGWAGDPDDHERMFFESGYQAGRDAVLGLLSLQNGV